MPGPLLALAGAAIPGVLNAASTMLTNRSQQKFSERMYNKQYADTVDFWNMQNAYNTPEQQMSRLTAAGLNPNLAFGGSAGNNTAGNLPTPDVQPVNFRAPQVGNIASDTMQILLAQADLKIKNAQADNILVDTEVRRQDAVLRGVQSERGSFDLDYARGTRDMNIDFLGESVRQKRVSTDLSINADARAAISTAASVSEAIERTLNLIESRPGIILQRGHTIADTARIAESIRQMQKDGTIKDFEIQLNKAGISKHDPVWLRMIFDFLDKHLPGSTPSTFKKYMDVPLTPKRN